MNRTQGDSRIVRRVAASFEVTPFEDVFSCAPPPGGMTCQLPLASGAPSDVVIRAASGDSYEFYDATGACSPSRPIRIDGNGLLIQGASVLVLARAFAAVRLTCDGVGYVAFFTNGGPGGPQVRSLRETNAAVDAWGPADYQLSSTNLTSDVVWSLPNAPPVGTELRVHAGGLNGHLVTVVGQGGALIDGQASDPIRILDTSHTYIYDGASWEVV